MAELTDFESCVILNSISGIGPARFNTLVSRFGTPSALLNAKSQAISSIPGIGYDLAEKLVHWENHCDLSEELRLVERANAQIFTRYDARYPEILLSLPDAPILLYVRGNLPTDLGDHSLAVVGTRRMTRYGRDCAQHLTEAAVLANWVIVSGLAAGVDAVAHESTCRLGGVTVGVLGGGLGRIYPQESVPLVRQIIEANGAVVSEFPMMMPPNRRTFPMRNRIVAGLSKGILVVEASLGSGSLITANLGLEYGRTLFAVPGAIDNPQSQGCHKLIKSGAKLVEKFDDIAEEFDFLPGFRVENPVVKEQPSFQMDEGDSPEEILILNTLRMQNLQDFDSLVVTTSLDVGILLSTLFQLELKRKIKTTQGGKYTFC